jgi:hypothetical protein
MSEEINQFQESNKPINKNSHKSTLIWTGIILAILIIFIGTTYL